MGKLILGRTPRSWFEIFVFYVFYYACIAAFYSATVGLFYSCLDLHEPMAQGESNWLEENPGMGFAPQISKKSSLVYVTEESIEKNIKAINEKLQRYKESQLTACTTTTKLRKEEKIACLFDPSTHLEGPGCSARDQYGYRTGEPCILVWINNIYNFIPEPYKCEDKVGKTKLRDMLKGGCSQSQVHFQCQGQTEADHENIKLITYYPQQGFDLGYFPYLNQPGYLQPLVFVKVFVKQGYVPVIITCNIIAKNVEAIPTVQDNYLGSTRIDLIVDMPISNGTTP